MKVLCSTGEEQDFPLAERAIWLGEPPARVRFALVNPAHGDHDHEPDAAALNVGLSGLVPGADPRFQATVDFVEQHLRRGSTVYRYRYDDGLPGLEGGFNLCTTWLIQAYALIGRREAAEQLFEQYTNLVGSTGLLAEQFDPDTRQALGNYPQAYSHLGLVNAALALDH